MEHLGIPKADFIEDVDEYMKGQDAETMLKMIDERILKYKSMQSNLSARRTNFKSKLPELEKTLEMIDILISKQREDEDECEPIETRFLLADHVYATAAIKNVEKVGLWLGLNVMLEYPITEAQALVAGNITEVTKALEEVENDLDFLKDQITTSEVSMARVYNWDVERRKAAKLL